MIGAVEDWRHGDDRLHRELLANGRHKRVVLLAILRGGLRLVLVIPPERVRADSDDQDIPIVPAGDEVRNDLVSPCAAAESKIQGNAAGLLARLPDVGFPRREDAMAMGD